MTNTLAQGLVINPANGDPVTIKGPLEGITSLTDLVSVVTNFLYPFAAVILLLVLIWGGYDFLMSRGDPEKVNGGKAKMTAGIIGFVLLMLSYLIARVLGFIFDVGNGIL